MRDKPHPNHRLEWPGGIVPEWARPQGNPNKRRRGKNRGSGGGGGGGNGKRERLQKVMAQSGHGSRRNIEILIAQGHLTINGQVAKLGDLAGPGDIVKLDGQPIALRFGDPLPQVLLYHKPEGEIVTRDDPQGRATVFEKLPRVQGGRWVSVGRLDLNTGGLLIFTTNGELANRLMHPRFEVEREYAVRLLGELTEESRARLLAGVEIEGETCKFDSIEDRGGEGANHWYHVVLREGKNREVRKMCEAVGLVVSRLMRVRFGPVAMPPHLKRGMMEEMEEPEVIRLLEFTGMREAMPAPAPAGAESAEEDDDDSQIRFLSRIPSPGQPGGRSQGQGHGQGQPQRQGQRHGQPQGQPHGKKWKQKHKRHGPPGQGQPGQGQPLAQPASGESHPPGQEGPVPQGQAGPMPGNGKPGGHRKRHRGRRGKGRFGQGQNAGGAAPQGEQAAGGDEQPLTNENRRPW